MAQSGSNQTGSVNHLTQTTIAEELGATRHCSDPRRRLDGAEERRQAVQSDPYVAVVLVLLIVLVRRTS